MKHKHTLNIILIMGSCLLANNVFAEVAIIANTASTGSLDAKSAKKLYLGKTKAVSGMTSVTLIGQVDSSPVKAEFTKKVSNKKLGKYKAYWSKMIFSGKAIPPKELANDAAVKSFVASNADAVGYIDAASLDDSVKVLLRLP